MKNVIAAALLGFGLLAGPSIASAASAEKPIQLAQVDMRIGPNGVRIETDRNRRVERGRFERDRRWERRRAPRCHYESIRERTRFGWRVQRVRVCR